MGNIDLVDYSRMLPYLLLPIVGFSYIGANVYTISVVVMLLFLCGLEFIHKFEPTKIKSMFSAISWLLISVSICLLVPLKVFDIRFLSSVVEVLFLLVLITPFSLFCSELAFSITDEFANKS